MEELKENNAPRDRAILVGLSSPRLDRKENADEESLEELGALVEKAGGTVTGRMAVLAEGGAADRKDILFLEKLPVFNADGSVK